MAVDIYIDSQIVVQTAAQWAADATVYSGQRLLITSDATYTGTDQRKFKIANGVDTWSNLDYFPVGAGTVDGSGSANTLPYWVDADTLGFLSTVTYPDLTEISYVKGVTSAIQTQLNGKEPSITTLPVSKGGTNSGTALTNDKVMISSAGAIVEANTTTYPSVTELSYVKGVTSAIQTQLNGKQATLTNPVTGTGTTNEITYFTGASTIGSLAVATYPSLTELSYVKGLSSALQTQLNNKQPLDADLTALAALSGTNTIYYRSAADTWTAVTVSDGMGFSGGLLTSTTASITLASNTFGPADSATYHIGGNAAQAPSGTAVARSFKVPFTGKLRMAYIKVNCTAGSNENNTFSLNNITAASVTTITSTFSISANNVANSYTGLTIDVAAGDECTLQWETPAYSSNPTAVFWSACLIFSL